MGTHTLKKAAKLAESKTYKINIDRIFCLGEIVEAHQYIDANQAKGKLVVVNS